MARLAIQQKTITDITDGYSVNLVPNAGSFSTTSQKLNEHDVTYEININAFQGSASVTPEVDPNAVSAITIVNGTSSGAISTTWSIQATEQTIDEHTHYFFPIYITIYGENTAVAQKTAYSGDSLIFDIPVYVEGTPINNVNNTPGDDDIILHASFVASGSQTGNNGRDGTDGTDGTSTYTWIRYANSTTPESWSDTSADPADMTCIGFAKTTTNSQPTSVSEYTWSKFVGTDGATGKDGYTFVVKSTAGDVFRNNSGQTDIILYIYKGDMSHITGANFQQEAGGTIHCFKDTVPTSGTTGELTKQTTSDGDYYVHVEAGNVVDVASYFWVFDENS